jgi:hypothetical protein
MVIVHFMCVEILASIVTSDMLRMKTGSITDASYSPNILR